MRLPVRLRVPAATEGTMFTMPSHCEIWRTSGGCCDTPPTKPGTELLTKDIGSPVEDVEHGVRVREHIEVACVRFGILHGAQRVQFLLRGGSRGIPVEPLVRKQAGRLNGDVGPHRLR